LLLTLFNIEGVLHYGIAGNVNSKFQIGDVTIPQYWAHTGLWHWQVHTQVASIILIFPNSVDNILAWEWVWGIPKH